MRTPNAAMIIRITAIILSKTPIPTPPTPVVAHQATRLGGDTEPHAVRPNNALYGSATSRVRPVSFAPPGSEAPWASNVIRVFVPVAVG